MELEHVELPSFPSEFTHPKWFNEYTPQEREEAVAFIKSRKRVLDDHLMRFVHESVIEADGAILETEPRQTERLTIYQPLGQCHRIGVFPGTHRVSNRDDFKLHQLLEWEILNNPYCAILMKDQLIHRGLESREDGVGMTCLDPRFFAYVYRGNTKQRKTRRQTMIGNEMKVHRNQCPKFVTKTNACEHCDERSLQLARAVSSSSQISPHLIDVSDHFGEKHLRPVPPGTIIFGDLEENGFVVFRSIYPPDDMISQVFGAIPNAKHTVQLDNKFRRLLHEANYCPSPNEPHFGAGVWQDWTVSVLEEIGKVTGIDDWYFDRPNIIFNKGPVHQNQPPHTDFDLGKTSEK